MDHSHPADQLDEAVLKMKKYWQNPKIYEFDTNILEINDQFIRLEENYFYPEGGGQPSDTGSLRHQDTRLQVHDVQEIDEVVWLHLTNHDLEEGDAIEASINKSRREILSRNHSGQHLLSAIFWEEFDLETTRALIDIQETEIEFDNTPDWQQLEKGLNLANKIIFDEHPIYSKFYDSDSISDIKLRGGVEQDHKVYRIVEIENLDLNACGGTHVNSTSEILSVSIKKLDGKRLKFVTGTEAQQNLVSQDILLHRISRELNTNSNKLLGETQRLYEQNKNLQKSVLDLENQVLSLELNEFSKNQIGTYTIEHREVSKLNRGLILDQIGNLSVSTIALTTTNDGGFILTTGSEDLTNSLMGYLREQGVRGGGRGVMMGTISDDLEIAELISEFLQSRS